MTLRLIRYVALFLCLFFMCGIAYAAGESFTIESITYTDAAGKQQTVVANAKTGIMQVPAIAVNDDMTINGTYAPATALVTSTIKVNLAAPPNTNKVSSAPTLNSGKWTVKITKSTLSNNTDYTVSSRITAKADYAIVDGVEVQVTAKTLSIAVP